MHIRQNLQKNYRRKYNKESEEKMKEQKIEILKDENGNYIKDTLPLLKFDKIDNDVISFYMQYNQLKNLYRQGWLKVRIGLKHKNKCESVADHSFSVALLCMSIIQKYKLDVDILKCLKMCIIHELGEIYVGDYTPFDNISKEEKHKKEKEAVQKALKNISFENDYMEIWQEFEEKNTEEAKLVNELDRLEFLMQSASYGYDIQYFKYSLNAIKSKFALEIVEELRIKTKGWKKPGKCD